MAQPQALGHTSSMTTRERLSQRCKFPVLSGDRKGMTYLECVVDLPTDIYQILSPLRLGEGFIHGFHLVCWHEKAELVSAGV